MEAPKVWAYESTYSFRSEFLTWQLFKVELQLRQELWNTGSITIEDTEEQEINKQKLKISNTSSSFK
jgi:hypothetical protein